MTFSPEPLARASAKHPWRTIGLWVLLIAIAIFLQASLLEGVITTKFDVTSRPDSKKADILLEDRLRGPRSTNEVVIVQSQSLTVDDAEFQVVVEEITSDIRALKTKKDDPVIKLESITNFYESGDEFLVSEDRQTTIIPLIMAGDFDDASDNIGSLVDVVKEKDAESELRLLVTGQAAVGSSGPHHQDSGEAKIRESTAGVSRKPSSDCKACGCSSKHLCGLTAWNT